MSFVDTFFVSFFAFSTPLLFRKKRMMGDRKAGMRTVTVRNGNLKESSKLSPDEEEKPEKKGLDKPDSRKDKGDDKEPPTFFLNSPSKKIQVLKQTRNGKISKKNSDNEDDEEEDVFTKTLSKMKTSRGRSDVGVHRGSIPSNRQGAHPSNRRK